ncbi:ABC transporter ATP-binding protein [Novosphingobium sp. AP12]|uniref:ABC transporter ATP-binding protein n=1 Tax=Novosphingobium sp. AP12 TaxID=1144305 RepID=UPI000271F1A9|nr:ABC transporter ATP-binding protein [Novosphingobium sp. AP12]EJL24216.1 ABC-type multidrug transport system, ATPase component [Novosphingobium sp. AP12]
MNDRTILDIQGVTKSFRKSKAVDTLDLRIGSGEIYALLGPNGAGKTTTINMVLGFIEPSSGTILVDGLNVAENPIKARSRIAYLPEMVALYPTLTGIENLHYFALLAGKDLDEPTCRQLLAEAGLQTNAHDRRAGDYSKGMRQKVGVAVAKAKDASLLLFDEPTSGLDPSASSEFYAMLRDLAGKGMAILQTTHDIWRVHEAATHIGILRAGVLVEEIDPRSTTPADLERIYVNRLAA